MRERKKKFRLWFAYEERRAWKVWFVWLIIRLDMHEWVIMDTLAGNRTQSERIMTISPFLVRKTVRLWPPSIALSRDLQREFAKPVRQPQPQRECLNKFVIYQRNLRRSIKEPPSNLNSIIRLLEIICALELSRESHFSQSAVAEPSIRLTRWAFVVGWQWNR